MSSFGASRLFASMKKLWQPQTQFVRFRYWKDQRENAVIRRYGYKDDPFPTGLLPRGDFGRIKCMPIYRPKDFWNLRRTTFGQNDYIDILGDGKLHPAKIAEGVPGWLKGFKGNEFTTLMRKFKYFRGTLPHTNPFKWRKMQTRFEQCFYYTNYKRKMKFK